MRNLLFVIVICNLFACKNGIKEEINVDGDTCFVEYNWGKKEGASNCFYFNQVKKSESWYENNQLTYVRNYDKNGLLYSYTKYKDEKPLLYESYYNGDNLNISEKKTWDYNRNKIDKKSFYANGTLEHTGFYSINPLQAIGTWIYYWDNGYNGFHNTRMIIEHGDGSIGNGLGEIVQCWTSQGQEIPNCEFLDSRLR